MSQQKVRFHSLPDWWHVYGRKMQPREVDVENRRLRIVGSAATLIIELSAEGFEAVPWRIRWEVRHANGTRAAGESRWSGAYLSAAFGLTNRLPLLSFERQRFLERYGADVGEEGYFIRRGWYLNIPQPGTGHDGGSTISIEIDEAIRSAIRTLLSST